jgi:hypothetical protein
MNTVQKRPNRIIRTIETLLSDKCFEFEKTFDSDGMAEWSLTTDDMCGCDITVIPHDRENHYGFQIRPYVTNQWGDNIYFPSTIHVDKEESILSWFKQTFVYELYYVRSFRKITQNIPDMAKAAGFEGICLPSKVQHGQNENGIEFVSEKFELEGVFNGIRKKIDVAVNAFRGKIFVSTKADGDWETISRDKDPAKALKKFQNRIERYLGQYDPHPRYYLMLLQDPTSLGKKVELFPLKHTKSDH